MEVSDWISGLAIPRGPEKLDVMVRVIVRVRVRVGVTDILFSQSKATLPDWGQKNVPERRMARRAKGVINNNYFHPVLLTPRWQSQILLYQPTLNISNDNIAMKE